MAPRLMYIFSISQNKEIILEYNRYPRDNESATQPKILVWAIIKFKLRTLPIQGAISRILFFGSSIDGTAPHSHF